MGQIDLKIKKKAPVQKATHPKMTSRLCQPPDRGFFSLRVTGSSPLLLVQSFFQRFCQLVRT